MQAVPLLLSCGWPCLLMHLLTNGTWWLAGDVIVVRIGDIVPADIKLLGDESDTSSPLQVTPVDKRKQ